MALTTLLMVISLWSQQDERLCELQMVAKRLVSLVFRGGGGSSAAHRRRKQSGGSVAAWYTTAMLDCLTRLTLLALIWTWITSPSPKDSAEWRRMMRRLPPRTDAHRQNPPRCERDVGDLTIRMFVALVWQALRRHTQSMYRDSLSFVYFFFFLQVAHLYQWLYFYILCNQGLNGRNARRSSIKQCHFPFKLQTFGLMFWLLDLSFRATSNPPAKFVNLLGRKVLVLSLLLFE